jgi:hypothetical protein
MALEWRKQCGDSFSGNNSGAFLIASPAYFLTMYAILVQVSLFLERLQNKG